MKSLINNLKQVKNALLTVTDGTYTTVGTQSVANPVPVYHYVRPENVTKKYIVWAEDGEETSFDADNVKQEQKIHGTIDYFTQTEFDVVCDNIQNALNSAGIGFRLYSVQYEDDTKLIHYEWAFWVA